MAKVNVVKKQVQMELDQIIKLQIITHCYIHNVIVSDLDIDCLINLGKIGSAELTDFCNTMAEIRLEKKFKFWKPNPERPKERMPEASPQTIRNILIKLEKNNLLYKEGKGRKTISLNPELRIQVDGNILLDYKFLCVES